MCRFNQVLLSILSSIALVSVSWGIPQMINYQGILLDGDGNPVIANTEVLFAIWDSPVTGDSLWSESHSVTPDTKGIFSVLLGSSTPIPDSALAGDVYVSTKVGLDPEMSPRAQLVSVAYAFRVGTIHGATGGIISGDVSIQSDLDVDGQIRTTGNVGINNAQPAYRLDVDGSLRVSAGGANFKKLTLDYETGGYSVLRLYDGGTQDDFRFTTNAGDDSWLNGPGNVGIGTKSPSEKLEVAGIMHSSSGGVRFPDGSLQTTAATGSVINSVQTRVTGLSGNIGQGGSFFFVDNVSINSVDTSKSFVIHNGAFVSGSGCIISASLALTSPTNVLVEGTITHAYPGTGSTPSFSTQVRFTVVELK